MHNAITLASLALIAPAAAQTALLREADPSPDGTVGQTIDGIGAPAVNQQGGYACSIDTEGTNGDVWQFWGNLAGGPGVLLREETTIGTLEQTLFSSAFGISSSALTYSGNATDTTTGTNGIQAVWSDDTPVMIEDGSVPGTSDFWTFPQSAGVTDGGVPYFRAGTSDTPGGSTLRRGLYFGAPLTAVYLTGDMLPNTPFALSDQAVDGDFRFSADGGHNITPVDLESGSSADDGAMAIDQIGLVLGGTLVREGELIPTSVGGTGDLWDNFDFCGITEAGDYVFTGDSAGGSTTDEFIVRNGSIWARESDILDGELLSGSLEGISINENGNIAFIWGIDVGPGAPDEALFFEDRVVLREGDAVDWDGDGVIDPAVTIRSFTGTNTVKLAVDGSIYFTADVDVNGVTLEGFFVLEGPIIGTSYCMANANSTGQSATTIASGSATLAENDVTLVAEGLPAFAFGFFLTSQTQAFITNPGGSEGNLCLSGSFGRYVGPGEIQSSGASGSITLAIDLTAMPQATGPIAAQVGETWNFQLWHRDQNMGVSTSNFTDGHSILFN